MNKKLSHGRQWSTIQRKTPMKRTGFKVRKPDAKKKPPKRLRTNTPDRAKLNRKMKAPRFEFLCEFPTCWNCGGGPTCCDEIVAGMSGRKQGIQHREAWTAICSTCNEGELCGSSPEILLRKLGLKLLYDPEHFDEVAVNRLRGKADGAITKAEVIVALCRRLDGRAAA